MRKLLTRAASTTALGFLFSGCTILHPTAWPRGSGQIVLTFDDGPTAHTDRLLDILARHQVKATFCVIGQNVAEHPQIVRRIAAEGHEIANHTFTHRLSWFSPSRWDGEILETDRVLQKTLGNRAGQTRLLRPPYGVLPPGAWFSREVSARQSAYLTTYVADAGCDARTAPLMLDRVKRSLLRSRGGAVVFHEQQFVPGRSAPGPSKDWLPDAIWDFIHWAGQNGLTFALYPEAARHHR